MYLFLLQFLLPYHNFGYCQRCGHCFFHYLRNLFNASSASNFFSLPILLSIYLLVYSWIWFFSIDFTIIYIIIAAGNIKVSFAFAQFKSSFISWEIIILFCRSHSLSSYFLIQTLPFDNFCSGFSFFKKYVFSFLNIVQLKFVLYLFFDFLLTQLKKDIQNTHTVVRI